MTFDVDFAPAGIPARFCNLPSCADERCVYSAAAQVPGDDARIRRWARTPPDRALFPVAGGEPTLRCGEKFPDRRRRRMFSNPADLPEV